MLSNLTCSTTHSIQFLINIFEGAGTISLIKRIAISLYLTNAPISYASPQNQYVNSDSNSTKVAAMMTSNCQTNRILKSNALIDYIFQDILKNYPYTGGGGVTSIKEVSTNTFEVTIAQEERIDVLLYALRIDGNCNVDQLKKTESAINFVQ